MDLSDFFENGIFGKYLYTIYFWLDREMYHHILLDNGGVRLLWDALVAELWKKKTKTNKTRKCWDQNYSFSKYVYTSENGVFKKYLYSNYFWVDREMYNHILLDNGGVRLLFDALAAEKWKQNIEKIKNR